MAYRERTIGYHIPDQLPEAVNPWMNMDISDFLYHLWFDNHGKGLEGSWYEWKTLQEVFGDVTHVCMGGSPDRAQRFANTLHKDTYNISGNITVDPIWKTERFSLHKVWKTISVSHGMGMSSMSILLHEVSKMLYYAKWCDENRLRDEVSFIRMGTSGGLWGEEGEWLWVKAGTVVISESGVDEEGEERNTVWKNGQRWEYPTKLDEDLRQQISAANITEEVGKKINTVLWKTMGSGCFYEWQGRVDGFFDPGYTEEDKMKYLQELYDKGVRNIEMESGYFAAFCLRAGIPGAIVCVALLNRLQWDQVDASILPDISENAEKIVLNYLRKVQAI